MNKQIEALKMAIREMSVYAMQHSNEWLIEDVDLLKAINACKEALAEAEKQEPVAWMRRKYDSGTNPLAVEWDYSDIQIFKHDIPLYTHPNQELLNEYWEMGYNQCLETNKKFPIPATWQSLSDDEKWNLINNSDIPADYDHEVLAIAHAIDAKLKEKNHG